MLNLFAGNPLLLVAWEPRLDSYLFFESGDV